MRSQLLTARRAVIATLAGGLLWVTAVGPGLSQGNEREPPGRDERPAAGTPTEANSPAQETAGESAGPAAATIKLLITGDGKPIAQAEVRISFPADSGGETTLRTNERGEAVFTTAWKGTAKMRVIATDWQSLLKDVTFTGAAQQLTVQLAKFE